jgi:drug/metabolite transporter (DMT)-like permease
MNPFVFALVATSLLCSIGGQLFIKFAMNETDESARRTGRFLPIFAAGIFAMAIGFFLWLGLMSRFPLSYLYPFEGLDRIILAAGAWFFLKEKMTAGLGLGVLLISVGVVLVSIS